MNPFSEGALSLRRRSVWEAIDSGILLWRSNFVHFIPFFALPAWIIACCLRFLPDSYFYLSYLILWWLKPFFDRLLLHVVSRRFFSAPGNGADEASGHEASGHEASGRVRNLRRGILKTLFRGLLGDLLWRRFSPGRAASMPIRILEQADKTQFRRRKKALAAGGLNFCSFATVFGLAAEGMLLLGEFLFVIVICQMFFPPALSYMRDNMQMTEIFIFAAYCLNFILAESLYVCMGFGLYINSRVEVEGWDLQLLFQKFSSGGSKVSGPAKNAALFICLFLIAAPAVHVSAEEPSAESAPVEFFPEHFPAPGQEQVDKLKESLASKDFGSEKAGWGIRFKENEDQKKIPDVNFAPWLEKIRRAFSLILRSLVVLVLAASVCFAFFWFVKFYRNSSWQKRRGRGGGYRNPAAAPQSPESLFARAEDLYGRNLFREAWAACLAGYIGIYSAYRSLSFPVDATEYDCLCLVRQHLPDDAEIFAPLVQNWVLLAYGGRSPAGGAFEEALASGRSLLNKAEAAGEP